MIKCPNCEEEVFDNDVVESEYHCDMNVCKNCYEEAMDSENGDYQYGGYEDDDLIDGVGFRDPGGRSALRAETRDNPRDQPCPECGAENVLTRIDKVRGYCCDRCADRKERGFDY